MPEFEEGFAEGVEEETIHENDNVIAEGENGDIADSARRNQARYALKRGRLPQLNRSSEAHNGHVPDVKIVDVARDAIGSRREGRESPRSAPVKKSTEVVQDYSAGNSTGREKRSDEKKGADGGRKFVSPKGSKGENASNSVQMNEQAGCKTGKFSCLVKKFLSFLGIGHKKGGKHATRETPRQKSKNSSAPKGEFKKYRHGKKQSF
ncbi:MAG: hypothetical protein LBI56_01345 [Puniceicoccales bacterium]|jgi:hypothetical protein|nr:hypothetical protein [Puniceicoccales bacterium]